MVNSRTETGEEPEKLITIAQIKLIAELYEETNYSRQYCAEELPQIDRCVANKHIQMLKDLKSREYQERKNHESGPVFDKIGFGMVYKLVHKAVQERKSTLRPTLDEFSDTLNEEYAIFKHCQENCRQFVKDGGLK